ncbi:hypothetical protein VHUM_01027 [Vanrija humicola]|uniref:Checkpoint protein RAD24-like helical bundle domain-containing protein n=1 Tax=Vanrija humicola TaxID=5417 RepID=A0A7D8V2B0_VANHU|nr:hypothetical protein VHUM_01027 [Vanrija humicola]
MLMTSLPNLGHLPTRDAFHATLLSLCQTFNSSSCPLIIVHSDSGSGGRAEESWMDRERGGRESSADVVGNDVKLGPWCAEVDFLPLAPTFVTKALNRVISLAIPDAAKRPSPGAVQLIAQSSHGDLRSSINSLQVLCTGSALKSSKKRKTDGDGKPSKATGRGSRGGKGAKIDVSEEIRAALDAVTRREQSLNLFHALGKVFYNKRLGDPRTDQEDAEELDVIRKLPPDDPLPEHLEDYQRSKSLVQMEAFTGTIPIDASTFALWIHSNIPSFCGEVDEMSEILDSFCAADVMRTDDDIWQSSPQAIAYALHLTVRGSLMGLPSPVIRANQKVTKPLFFDSYRLERSNASLLDVARGHFARKAVASSADWVDGLVDDNHAVPWGGLVSKDVLARELVPMAVKVQTLSRTPLLPVSVQPLVLPPFSNTGRRGGVELKDDDQVDDADPLDIEMAGEDGLGAPEASHWDTEADVKDKEELGWLADDDIEDWD